MKKNHKNILYSLPISVINFSIQLFVWLKAAVAFGLNFHDKECMDKLASRKLLLQEAVPATFIIPFSVLLSSNISRGSCVGVLSTSLCVNYNFSQKIFRKIKSQEKIE